MNNQPKCATCDDTQCEAQRQRPDERQAEFAERQALAARMCGIRHKLVVLSGKGGVGKSTVAVNLASALVLAGKRVGLLDIDIHGPSVPKLLHIDGFPVHGTGSALAPVEIAGGLKVMSIGLLLRSRDDPVIWRGPMKHKVIQQFLSDVEWGQLDYLVVDCPPGTGDEPLAIVELLHKPSGAIVVTTPQQLAVQDVRRSVRFCQQLALPVLGVIENMSGYVCPTCGAHSDIFGAGGGKALAEAVRVPFLGAIPLDPQVVRSGDDGRPFVQSRPHSETAKAFGRVVRPLLDLDVPDEAAEPSKRDADGALKIALPIAQGKLCSHFGHCEHFAVFDVDRSAQRIEGPHDLDPPAHEPGVLPNWLGTQGVQVVIAGGMGAHAQSQLAERDIEVVVGAIGGEPAELVRQYLEGTLQTGPNACDH